MERQNRYDYWDSLLEPNSSIKRYKQHLNNKYFPLNEESILFYADELAIVSLNKEIKDFLFPK